MALPVLPNPDNFLAVALVINRSRDGPRFVFHYPPHVLPVQDQSSKQDPDDDLDDDDDMFADRRGPRSGADVTGGSGMPNLADLAQWNQDDHFITEGGSQIVPWEYVAGFPTKDLENILTPARAYHKSLFQVSLDPIYCVSYPVHVPENGIWKKKKKKEKKQEKQEKKRQQQKSKEAKNEEAAADSEDPASAEGNKSAQEDDTIKAEDADNVDVKDMAKSATEEDDKVSSMNMFNLVFILNPEKHEAKELVDTMYTHIIKKVNKAYKYCQQRSDFVWKESKKILTLKDKAREDKRRMSSLWNEILSTSSLAASMQDIYDAISQNKIAALQLDTSEGTVTPSVQIPVPFHIADLPPLGEEDDHRGLWITTSNSFTSEDTVDEPGYLDKNFALLLMYDEKKIVADLQSDPDDFATSRMIDFVKHSKPNMSFHQVAQQNSNVLTLGEVRKFAQHFIFWRRAIAIPPLHARDVYILSPNCDVAHLPRAAAEWARAFPFAPTLPQFLSDLSAAPRPYKFFCPAKSYRPDYLRMLAWLMRGGWVAQLCTFAYVVVWPEIIYEVEYALEADELARAKQAQHEKEVEEEEEEEHHEDADGDPHGGGGGAAAGSSVSGRRLNNSEEEDNADGDGDDRKEGEEDLRSSVATIRSRPRVSSEASDNDNSNNSNGNTLTSPLSTSQISLISPTTSVKSPTASTSSLHLAAAASLQHLASPTTTSIAGSSTSSIAFSPTTNPTATTTGTKPQPTPAEAAAQAARRARLASRAARTLADRATAHARKQPPLATPHPSVNAAPHLAHLAPHVVLDAKKATGAESLYLSAVGRRLRNRGESTRAWDERVAAAWPDFCAYFNGRAALERVALQEDMKRKDAWNLLTAMSEYLLCVRHW